jgi:hypothetical protein
VENEKPLLAGFDYRAETEADVVLSVADSIRSANRLAPVTDEQKLQRRIEIEAWNEQQAFLAEERRFEYEQRQAEIEAVARHEAALEQQEANRKARLALQERQRERDRDQQLVGLQIRAKQQEVWQSSVENAARIGLGQRARTTLLGELEKMLTPPAPPSESNNVTEIVYVSEDEAGSPHLGDRDFNPKLWTKI